MTLRNIELRPIDDAARTGRFQLVFGGDRCFACVRWNGVHWVFSSDQPLDFAPEFYAPDSVTHHG